MSIAEKLQAIAENEQRVYNAGFEAGKAVSGDSWYDTFWDSYQTNGKRNQWNNAFANNYWTDITYNPKHPITPIYYANTMFSAAYITDTRFPLDFSTLQKQEYDMFRYCRQLVTIQELTVNENITFQNWFSTCPLLENITFNGKIGQSISFAESPLLSAESIANIVEHLATVSVKTTITINSAIDMSAYKSTIEGKGWTLVQ